MFKVFQILYTEHRKPIYRLFLTENIHVTLILLTVYILRMLARIVSCNSVKNGLIYFI